MALYRVFNQKFNEKNVSVRKFLAENSPLMNFLLTWILPFACMLGINDEKPF